LLCDYLAQNHASAQAALGLKDLLTAVKGSAKELNDFAAANGFDLDDASGGDGTDTPARRVWATGACATLIKWEASQVTDDTATNSADNHLALVELDLALTHVDHWLDMQSNLINQKPVPNTAAVVTQANDRFQSALASVHKIMQAHQLLNSFSAGLFAGSAIATTNRLVGTAGDSSVTSRIVETDSTSQVNSLTVESAHFGWEGEHHVDVSFRAQAASRPVLNLLSASTGGSVTPATVAVLQQALVVSAGARFGIPFEKPNLEVSGVMQLGADQVTSDAVTFDDKKPPIVATGFTPSSRAASFAEFGVELNLFDNPVRVLHAEKGLVTPAVSVSAGYRNDSRFDPANYPGLATSPDRLYFRFIVDAVKTVSTRNVGETAKPFDIGFGLEYERAWFHSTSSVPSSIRFLIRGDINLLKAAGSSDKNTSTPPAAPAGGGTTPGGSE
jgi:hypothetical protein